MAAIKSPFYGEIQNCVDAAMELAMTSWQRRASGGSESHAVANLDEFATARFLSEQM